METRDLVETVSKLSRWFSMHRSQKVDVGELLELPRDDPSALPPLQEGNVPMAKKHKEEEEETYHTL